MIRFSLFLAFRFYDVTALAVKFGLPLAGQQQHCRAN